jgi:hypothetical protein
MTDFFRQGDVILEKIDMAVNNCIIEESATMEDTKIIAYGEATGHSHFFDDSISKNGSQVSLYKEINQQNPTMVIIKDKTALLKHQDHLHICIPKGIYRIKRERSYNPFVSQEQKKIHVSYD